MDTPSPAGSATEAPALLLWHPNAILRDALGDWLRRTHAGHPVYLTDDPTQALQLAQRADACVALIDVDTRHGDALALLRMLRRYPHVHCIALTLYNADFITKAAMEAGAYACISIVSPDSGLSEAVEHLLHQCDDRDVG